MKETLSSKIFAEDYVKEVLTAEDVKQFIKDLKEEVLGVLCQSSELTRSLVMERIDTLVGEELLEESS